MDKSLLKIATQMISSPDIEMVRLGALYLEDMKLGTLETMKIIDRNLDKRAFRYNIDLFDGEIEISEGGERKVNIITGAAGMAVFAESVKQWLKKEYGRTDKKDAGQR